MGDVEIICTGLNYLKQFILLSMLTPFFEEKKGCKKCDSAGQKKIQKKFTDSVFYSTLYVDK
jgi:hypothetical protein